MTGFDNEESWWCIYTDCNHYWDVNQYYAETFHTDFNWDQDWTHETYWNIIKTQYPIQLLDPKVGMQPILPGPGSSPYSWSGGVWKVLDKIIQPIDSSSSSSSRSNHGHNQYDHTITTTLPLIVLWPSWKVIYMNY